MVNNKIYKPWTSFAKQLEILESRGMDISDTDKAIRYLSNIGYYRLSGYWRAFQVINAEGQFQDEFVNQTSFTNILDLYVFDKRLRLLLLDAIERFEIALRVDISHLLGEVDPLSYLNRETFNIKFTRVTKSHSLSSFEQWLIKYKDLLKRKIKAKSPFILHNINNYGDDLSVWVACEIWDFGCISKLYEGLMNKHKNMISEKYGISQGNVFANWIWSINLVRNICSHHDRLWNHPLPVIPQHFKTLTYLSPNHKDYDYLRSRIFIIIFILRNIIRVINPNSTWIGKVTNLLENFPHHDGSNVNISKMGAPKNWKEIINS